MADIVIVCEGDCGRTTEGMTFETRAGEFRQVDESGVPVWTCPECLEVCECGDYRYQHENRTGKCKMPNDMCHGFRPCLKFIKV